MSDQLQSFTDAEADKLSRKIARVYRQAAAEVKEKLKEFEAKHKKKSEELLQQVKDGTIAKADYEAWLRGQVFQGKQWKKKLADITAVYTHADEEARALLGGVQKNVFKEAANYTAYKISDDLRAAVSFDTYDKATVERLLRKKPKLLPEWKIDEPKDYTWNSQRVRNAVAQGIIQGESVSDIGARLSSKLASSNGLKMNMFALTAVNSAQNSGRMERLHEAQDMGIEVKKQWLATLDGRTRDTHRELDGQTQDIDKPFVVDGMKIDYPGDPSAPPELTYNCRCTLVYVYPKYNFGEGKRYAQDTGEVIPHMSYKQWKAAKKSEDE